MERKKIIPVVAQGGSSPVLQSKTVTPTALSQTVTADQNYDGLSSVTVNPTPLQAKAATPSTSQQTISPDENYVGLSAVAIGAVTSAIDANITAGNIKKDVTILGVTGTYEGGMQENKLVEVIGPTKGFGLTAQDLAGLTYVRDSGFSWCSRLNSIELPNTVTSIGSYAFQGTAISEIVLPSSVSEIRQQAFRGVTNLTVTCLRATPPTLGANAFYQTTVQAIYVPAESVETYKAASNWSAYANVIQAIPNS